MSKLQHVCYWQVLPCADSAKKWFSSRELHLGLATPGLHGTKTETEIQRALEELTRSGNKQMEGVCLCVCVGGVEYKMTMSWAAHHSSAHHMSRPTGTLTGLCPDVWEGGRAEQSYRVFGSLFRLFRHGPILLN